MRRASAPLGASADQDVTVHVHAIRPIHQPISRCLPRARTQCPRKMLPLATRDGQGVVCGCFSFPAKREWSTSLDEDLWARGGARSSFAAEIVLWTIRGTPHSHLPLKCERPRLYLLILLAPYRSRTPLIARSELAGRTTCSAPVGCERARRRNQRNLRSNPPSGSSANHGSRRRHPATLHHHPACALVVVHSSHAQALEQNGPTDHPISHRQTS